jgi:hypothetical protein
MRTLIALGVFLLVACTQDISADNAAKAKSLCEPNGGLLFIRVGFTHDQAVCANAVEIKLAPIRSIDHE